MFPRFLWVLTHADLRTTARVRAVVEHLVTALTAQRPLFRGAMPLASGNA